MSQSEYAIRAFLKPSLPYNCVCRRIPEARIFHYPVDSHIASALHSAVCPHLLSTEVLVFVAFLQLPLQAKLRKTVLCAPSKGQGFPPIGLFQDPMEDAESMDSLKGRDFIFLQFYNLLPSGKGQAPVFDVFEAFLNTDNIQVFANAATSYIMCLMKFVKGLGKWGLLSMPRDSWGPCPG